MLTKRMAMRRMNEMWRRMALTLVFCVLLFHTCQSQNVSSSATSRTTDFTMTPVSTQSTEVTTDQQNTTDQLNTTTQHNTTPTNPTSKACQTQNVSTIATSRPPRSTMTPVRTQSTEVTTEQQNTTTQQNTTVLHDTTNHTTTEDINNDTDSKLQGSEELQVFNTHQGFTNQTFTNEEVQNSLITSEATSTQTVVHNNGAHPNRRTNGIPDSKDVNSNNIQIVEEEVQKSPEGNSKNVFVPILVCGLILAAALIGLYVKRNHCPTSASGGMKLADESCMADEDNQGNTLVSVAPLNPPENQEKPSLNGESLEAVKIQNPPAATNGHSTAKADTEL